MGHEVPELFDPVKIARAETRALRAGPATFLLERAVADLEERLATLLRSFRDILDLGTPFGAFGAAAKRRWPDAQLTVRAPGAPDATRSEPLDFANLGLEPARHDLIVSGFALHRANDPPGALIQLRRALKPDGLLLACFPGGDTLTELRQSLLAAESQATGGAALRVFPAIDVRSAGQLAQRAGLALPVVDCEPVRVRYASMPSLVRDLRAMGAGSGCLARTGPPIGRALLAAAAARYATDFGDPDGRIGATFECIWLSGWAPHASQQQPLKPGSAKASLAEALARMAADRETG